MTITPAAIEPESALASEILEIARAITDRYLGSYWSAQRCWNDCGRRNQPLLLLLDAMTDASTATARAIEDNCWDEQHPIPADKARQLAEALHRIADTITRAAAPADNNWSLPSMTGKELV